VTGKGQIVQVVDTGLDQYSCFFYDENGVTATSNASDVKANTVTTDLTKRKVVQYVAWVDSGDYESGHGTHVAGSVAGSVYSSWGGLTDSCTSASDVDGVDGCEAPELYSDCSNYVSSCTTLWAPGSGYPEYENACPQTCYCTESGYPQLRGDDTSCENLIRDNDGAAPDAKIAVYDVGDADGALDIPSDMESYIFKPAYEIGARISSNSWGVGCVSSYGSRDLQVDSYTWDNPDILILFAAGNDGDDEDCGEYNLCSPGTSKNGLTVGASETGRWPTNYKGNYDPDNVAGFSSYGLTYDGRLKPDVVAPGYHVMSADAVSYATSESCQIKNKQGTSMATPIAAGTAALVRQYLMDGFYAEHARAIAEAVHGLGAACLVHYTCSNFSSPSGSLVKALLVNSAHGMQVCSHVRVKDRGN
jgi:subtilisin family serine protease